MRYRGKEKRFFFRQFQWEEQWGFAQITPGRWGNNSHGSFGV